MALSGSYIYDFTSYFWLRLDWSATQSVSGNYSIVTAKLYFGGSGYTSSSGTRAGSITIDGTKYSLTASTVNKSRGQTILLFSKSKTVYHNADGTKTFSLTASIDLKLTLSGTYYGTVTVPTQSYTLNTIPRASDFSVNNFTIGNNIPITISRASSSFTHNFAMYHTDGTFIGEWLNGYTTSATLILNETHQNRIYQRIPNAISISVKITCRTYNGSTLIGSKSKNVTAYVDSSIVPTFTTITHSENNLTVKDIVGKYIQGLSKLNLAITGAAGAKYSTIKSYQITFEGVNYNTQSAVTNIIKGSGNLVVTGKITDSRDRTATKSVTVEVLPYIPPKITAFILQRCFEDGTVNDMGEYVKITWSGSISSLINIDEKNSLTYRIKSKVRGASTWETKKEQTISGISFSGSEILGTYSATLSYDFRFEISDKFNTTISLNILSTGTPVLSWGKTGVGIGKVWEQGALDVGGDVYINNALAGYVDESGFNSNGRWIRFSDGTQICIIHTSVTTDSTQNYVAFDVVFPAHFINTDYALSHAWYGGVPGRSGAFSVHAGKRQTGSITGATYTSLNGTNFSSVTRTVATIVIGRWK
jgi:hypothetical protein